MYGSLPILSFQVGQLVISDSFQTASIHTRPSIPSRCSPRCHKTQSTNPTFRPYIQTIPTATSQPPVFPFWGPSPALPTHPRTTSHQFPNTLKRPISHLHPFPPNNKRATPNTHPSLPPSHKRHSRQQTRTQQYALYPLTQDLLSDGCSPISPHCVVVRRVGKFLYTITMRKYG